MNFKKCSKCGEEKAVSEFGKKTRNKDGFENNCKVCRSQYRRQKYLECPDPEGRNQRRREKRLLNRDKINQRRREKYAKNPGPLKERAKEWAKNNPEKKVKMDRSYYKRNKSRIKKQTSLWAKNNPEKVLEYRRKTKNKHRVRINRKNRQYMREQINNLGDWYIKSLLTGNTNLCSNDISEYLISTKKAQIQHLRIIKELKAVINE